MKEVLHNNLENEGQWSIIGILLALVPNLRGLSILPDKKGRQYPRKDRIYKGGNFMQAMFPSAFPGQDLTARTDLHLLRFSEPEISQNHARDRICRLQTFHLLPNITTLDITPASTSGFASHHQILLQDQSLLRPHERTIIHHIDHISHLRWDCRSTEIGLVRRSTPAVGFFQNLRILDLYGSASKQASFDISQHSALYTTIVDSAYHLRDSLEVLRLPGGWRHAR